MGHSSSAPPHQPSGALWHGSIAVLSFGGILFGYPLLARFDVVPSTATIALATGMYVSLWDTTAFGIGALYLGLGGVVVRWYRTRESARPLTVMQTTIIVVIIPLLATGVTVLLKTALWPLYRFSLQGLYGIVWLFIGLGILSIQFVVGYRASRWRRLGIFLTEIVAIFVLTPYSLTTLEQLLRPTPLGRRAVLTFILFGGPLYLLGSRTRARSTE